MAAIGSSTVNVDIKNCPRCGQDHEDVEFTRFGDNPVAGFTHFGACPDNGEPILIKVAVIEDGELSGEPKTCGSSGGCVKR
jgi:hypothetical protein